MSFIDGQDMARAYTGYKSVVSRFPKVSVPEMFYKSHLTQNVGGGWCDRSKRKQPWSGTLTEISYTLVIGGWTHSYDPSNSQNMPISAASLGIYGMRNGSRLHRSSMVGL